MKGQRLTPHPAAKGLAVLKTVTSQRAAAVSMGSHDAPAAPAAMLPYQRRGMVGDVASR